MIGQAVSLPVEKDNATGKRLVVPALSLTTLNKPVHIGARILGFWCSLGGQIAKMIGFYRNIIIRAMQ